MLSLHSQALVEEWQHESFGKNPEPVAIERDALKVPRVELKTWFGWRPMKTKKTEKNPEKLSKFIEVSLSTSLSWHPAP